MRAGSVHPQWHLRRDGRRIGGGPRLEELFLFRFLALSGPVDGAREGCIAEKVPVRKYTGWTVRQPVVQRYTFAQCT